MMDKCSHSPYEECREQGDGQRKLHFETKEGNKKKEDTRKNSPKCALCKELHSGGVTIIFKIHPYEDQDTCQWHNRD